MLTLIIIPVVYTAFDRGNRVLCYESFRISLKRPVTAAMVTLSVPVGYVAFGRLPIEQFQHFILGDFGRQICSASPEEVNAYNGSPEAALGTLNNVDRFRPRRAMERYVRVDFKAGTDMDLANMEMRERADQARSFTPSDVDRVQLRRWQSDQRPIVYEYGLERRGGPFTPGHTEGDRASPDAAEWRSGCAD